MGKAGLLLLLLSACGRISFDEGVGSAGNGDGGGGDDGSITAPDASCIPGTTTVAFGDRPDATGVATDTFLINVPNDARNYGTAPTLALCAVCSAPGTAWDGSTALALIRFDTSSICPAATIQNARLDVTTTTDNLGTGTVGVFVVREGWVEGPGGATGFLGPANWNNRNAGIPWANAGVGAPVSRDTNPVASFAPLNMNAGYQTQLPVAVVQQWVTDPSMNHGLALVITSGNSDAQFHSRESATATSRPLLVVTAVTP